MIAMSAIKEWRLDIIIAIDDSNSIVINVMEMHKMMNEIP